ncbi:ATP-binding cassette domain-containing protein [Spiractinospora alimapuensis]|uniref:ABC transporter ATP-binding protein n=1 Tax=Spiractinospora alimapuensis TaxID=2820884 RepID=UPI001F47A128|nr:ATP-binding cassette domain-containing protein [Spiractinospora alimapuensis]QVQ54550.1 ATP-binding cassette domain-containing protein [Spiractinospora alimapuensis]
MTEALRVSGVSKTLGRHPALQGVELTVRTGEVYGLLGPNGAGKTTLMKTIAGLLRQESGTISVFGRPLGSESRRGLGTLIDGPGLWPRMNAEEHVRVHARLRGVPEEWGRAALHTVGMADIARRRVSAYSLGMRWRLGIALALVARPRLLVLDEPTNGLDPIGMRDMRELLRRLAENGITAFVSSHQLDQIARTCDRVGVLVAGSTHYEGPLSGLASDGDLEQGFLDLVTRAGTALR